MPDGMSGDALVARFRAHVAMLATDPGFVHHGWYLRYHLEIVERIAGELAAAYPSADRRLVDVLVWLHDYGKIIGAPDDAASREAGGRALRRIGLDDAFVDRAVRYCSIIDGKRELDRPGTPIEVQIVSSADGCAHLVGPFLAIWWRDHPERSIDELMADNRHKIDTAWHRKIVLPVARERFAGRHAFLREQTGALPDHYL